MVVDINQISLMINPRHPEIANPRRKNSPSPGPVGMTTKKVQDYLIFMNDILGRGNFSQVYRGINTKTNQQVAVKVVELSSLKTVTLINLLRSEIQILRTLNHPNVLRCYDIISSANNCYIVTELCNQGDLETIVLKTKGTLQEQSVKKFNCDIYMGLKYLAEQHIVHRDLKVANIFIRDGAAKIADFGFAKRAIQRFKDVNVGSPIYMPPESLLQSVYSPKTDVWAFGIILYQLLHGNPPLAFCKSQQQLKANIAKPFNVASLKYQIPDDLKDLIIRCLDVDQNRRISASEIQFHPYLQRVMQELGVQRNLSRPQSSHSYQNLPPSAYLGQNSVRSTSNDSNLLRFQPRQMQPQERSASNQPRNTRSFSTSNQQAMFGRSQMNTPRNIPPPISPPNNYYGGQSIRMIPASNSRTPSPQIRQITQNQTVSFNQQQSRPQSRQNNFFQTPMNRNNSVQEFQSRGLGNSSNSNANPYLRNPPTFSDNSIVFSPATSARANLSTGSTTASLTDPAALTFDESVQFLHYCRLIYKAVQYIKSNQRMSTLREIDFFTNWLLFMIQDLQIKSQPNLDPNNPRHIKLKTVLRDYNERYSRQFRKNQFMQTSMNSFKSIIDMILQFLDNKILVQPEQDQQQLIIIGQYLCFLQETNSVVKRCIDTKDYSEVINCRIDQFLNLSPSTFTAKTYSDARDKLLYRKNF